MTIGRPIANAQLYVLDERDRIAPPGAFGTLFIGGDGLAKGYFDRPDLTARAFREISLAGLPPRRLYDTGDRARLLPSGEVELRGRNDRQVKLRGFRIELEEIESALRQTADVRDCAVLLRHDMGPDPVLVAYVVTAGGDPGRAQPTWRGACPTTWCRRAGSRSMPCPSRPAASSTATPCRGLRRRRVRRRPPRAPRRRSKR